jgi:hypothetical protein
MGGRLPTYRFMTRNSAMTAAWFVVIEYRLHKKFSPILKDESYRHPSIRTEFPSPGCTPDIATARRSSLPTSLARASKDRDHAAARSSLSAPRATILSASSASGLCNAFASSHGARIQTSRSSSVVRITGMALG